MINMIWEKQIISVQRTTDSLLFITKNDVSLNERDAVTQ